MITRKLQKILGRKSRKILLLISGKSGSGKDTFYEAFSKLVISARVALADPIKMIAKKHFNWDGNKDEYGRKLIIDIGQYLGNESDDIDESVKKVLDKIFSRDKSIWAKIAAIKIMFDKKPFSVITDWRMIKELSYLNLLFDNIYTVRINRDDFNDIGHKKTESELDDFNFDFVIDNNGSLKDLEEQAKEIKWRILNDY